MLFTVQKYLQFVFPYKKYPRTCFAVFLIALFALRLAFGLNYPFRNTAREIDDGDVLQIYLLGLKYYTTGAWPFYGPDVVYTNTQIAGALQGLLVGIPFYIFPLPESPIIFLNLLTFASLSLFAYYIKCKFSDLSKYFVWAWIMLLSWTMLLGVQTINSSYVLIFSIPFFLAFLEILPLYKEKVKIVGAGGKWSYLIMGVCTTCIMQLHMSFVLLLAFIATAFFFDWIHKKNFRQLSLRFLFFLIGAVVGLSTLIPTWVHYTSSKSIIENVVFNPRDGNIFLAIVLKIFSYATMEMLPTLSLAYEERMDILLSHWWVSVSAGYLYIFGIVFFGAMIFCFFIDRKNKIFTYVKIIAIATLLLAFFSFFFTIPDPHVWMLHILLPIYVFYSFFCIRYLWCKSKYVRILFIAVPFAGVVLYASMVIHNYNTYSIYQKERVKIVRAIAQKDYTILGKTRADYWGYGY